ncbi:hypothetical protein CF327_g6497 [Tilletia walkeri]|uniref:AB hydrolase-1 domain-containing protein n=1 Tax=Tilletia walkeri TaxID=117179 RepID=A0A8X7N5A3_9BASI|nr:hypothetical protein CF327_g6497 [Tilletia walkeri]KAE8266809.1 hypothetical protein A4X09_0g5532 [Tilletia walkeri]
MPRVPPVYPPPGTSPIADAIRARRGARGLTPLDGTLLQSPAYAEGWNALLGAVRSQTGVHLPADVREIIILRIAARNRAAFEWIQHEPVARNEGGLKTDVLSSVRLTGIEPSSTRIGIEDLIAPKGPLSPLQATAVIFTDESTLDIRVQDSTFAGLRNLLLTEGKRRAAEPNASVELKEALKKPMDFAFRAITEATATAATYNMVSRFLVALDVDDRSLEPVPIPTPDPEPKKTAPGPKSVKAAPTKSEKRQMVRTPDGQLLASLFHPVSDPKNTSASTIICINSLMTDLSMWDYVLPSLREHCNVITYDQRGHGFSSIPPKPCTLAQLADDTATVLSSYGVEKAKIVIGVSQGGATALAFLMRHPDRAEAVIACDTQAKSPDANAKAWDDRIQLVLDSPRGMAALADKTLPRWYTALFPSEQGATQEEIDKANPRRAEILAHTTRMITQTPVQGFIAGARALQNYDLLKKQPFEDSSPDAEGLIDILKRKRVPLILLAGANDEAPKKALYKLYTEDMPPGNSLHFISVKDAGHLPMVDQPDKWVSAVKMLLRSIRWDFFTPARPAGEGRPAREGSA